MSCTEFDPVLDDLVDGTLSTEARARAEAHLASCASCHATVADLRRIREAARSLPRVTPPADGWLRLSAALDAETTKKPVTGLPQSSRRIFGPITYWNALAAAAVLVLAVSSGLFLFYRPGQPATTTATTSIAPAANPAAHVESPDLVQTVETELELADQHYQKAIAGLELVAREGQSTLDSQTAAVLSKNLGIIDQAIRESREALRSQPASEVAQMTLFEALRNKVDLLKDTVALINEMRKGNQAGAAQIVGGLGKG